jgi:uncharacterized protein with NAD-binding domain and iron-sulfur cluster
VGKKVIIIGGGVAGMTAAHELIERGFDVVVFELRDIPGGKARSIKNRSRKPAEKYLPGEHGFRFFPGFYRHIPDTMSRIPLAGGGWVIDNLTQSTRIETAREDAPPMISPAQFPRSLGEGKLALDALWVYATQLGISVADQIHFYELLTKLQCSCERRRFGEYENESWWTFSGAQDRSKAYGMYFADGLTRTLVAAQAREMSARTGGYILLQLLQDMLQPGLQVDRVLNAPTNDAWIGPWLEYLRGKGVDYRLRHRVDAIHSNGSRVTGVAGHRITWPQQAAMRDFEEEADFYISAVPVEVMQKGIDIPLKASVPALGKLDDLKYRWMNGIVFYLGQDVPVVHGHLIFIDSAWSLTAISQRQFWPDVDFSKLGNGSVQGILSVDISDWETKGQYTAAGKRAMDCSRKEIAAEVWEQLKASLNGTKEILSDANLVGWFLDPDIVSPNPKEADTNLEPLLVNVAGSWENRPEPALPEVENLFLAADYVRTYTDLATMEGANEAARRAVNAILDAAGSSAKRCEVWPLHELGGPFALARAADNLLYRGPS